MPVVPLGYPLDLTGVAPSNLISNEIRTFTIAADRVFVPAGGPFFTTGMQIRHGVTNALLQPNTQYKLLHLHKTASLMARKEICAVILILDNAVPSVKLTYQIIGSYFADTADTIRDLVTANPITNPTTIPWGSIFGAPSQFPPVEHLHHVDELYGMSDVVAVLEQLRQTILLGDSFAISAIYQYINNLLTNLDYATYNQVLTLFNSIERPPIKVYNTYADLRAETDVVNDAALVYLTLGKDSPTDGKGRAFYWDVDSAIIDDNDITVKPTIISAFNTGRFISILAVEKNLKDSLKTLGRAVKPDGTVNTDISLVNDTIISTVDFNTAIESGVFVISGDNGNIGNPGHHVNWPPNTLVGKLEVEHTSSVFSQVVTTLVQMSHDQYDSGSFPEYPIHTRTGILLTQGDPITWSNWSTTFTKQKALRNGIDSVLSVDNSTTADVNALIYPGKYWVTNVSINRPFDNAEIEVVIIEGTRNIPTRVLQKAFNGTQIATREGVKVATVWTFGVWVYHTAAPSITTAEIPDCHLGICIRYNGFESVLMPCYIGEDNTSTDVTVFISGALKTISLYNIQPLDSTYANINKAYIYLTENPPGTFKLTRDGVAPVSVSSRSMTLKREQMNPSVPVTGSTTVESSVFLGMAIGITDTWIMVRNWLQDPGFFEDYQLLTYADELIATPSVFTERATGSSKLFVVKDYYVVPAVEYPFGDPLHGKPVNPVSLQQMADIHLLLWAGERAEVTFAFQCKLKSPTSYVNGSITVTPQPEGYFNQPTKGVITNSYITNAALIDTHPEFSQIWDTVNGTGLVYADTEEHHILSLTGAVGNPNAQILIQGGYYPNTDQKVCGSAINVTLEQVMNYRHLSINTVGVEHWYGTDRTILLNGNIFDLNLKDYHDALYGSPAPANSVVEFILRPGCLVSASSAYMTGSTTDTVGYAIVNPDTWATGVVVKLTIQAGAGVSGRGGDGGRGGQSYSEWIDINGDTYYDYVGGLTSDPNSYIHGKRGGNAIRTLRDLIITNLGFISVGNGGGGGSSGAEVRFNTAGNVSRINLSGNGGGGGWPWGAGGRPGAISAADTSQADYLESNGGGGYSILMTSGNAGESAGGLGVMKAAAGGPLSTRTNGNGSGVHVTNNAGGRGGLLSYVYSIYPEPGGSSSWAGETGYIGGYGNQGGEGAWAINSTGGGSVTFLGANQGYINGLQI